MSENGSTANEWQQARIEAQDAYKQIVMPWLKALRNSINPSLEVKAGDVDEDMLGDDTFQARCGNSHFAAIRGGWRFQAIAKLQLLQPATWKSSVEIKCSRPYSAEHSGALPLQKSKVAEWFSHQLVDIDKHLRGKEKGVESLKQSPYQIKGSQPVCSPTTGRQSSGRAEEPTASEGANAHNPDLEHGVPRQRLRSHVFISYSHKDKRWLEDLQTHLKPFLRHGLMTAWSDQQIATGSKWFSEIRDALGRTSVAVLLVTPNFLASDFIHEHELAPILNEAESGGVRIVWIPVGACAFETTRLKDYQAVVSPDKPLATMKKANRDCAWVKICQEIKRAAKHG